MREVSPTTPLTSMAMPSFNGDNKRTTGFIKLITAAIILLILVRLLCNTSEGHTPSSDYIRSEEDRCWSRSESINKNYLLKLDSSSLYKTTISRYLEHHRNCMRAASNVTDDFFSKRNVSYDHPQKGRQECQFLIFEGTSQGLGNKFQALVSAFGYAILTNRVFLTMDFHAMVLLCNPFSDSGWYVPYDMGQKMKYANDISAVDLSLPPDEWKLKLQNHTYSASLNLFYNDSVVKQNFFCESQQVRLRKIRFVVLSSEQYFLPALYYIPSFRDDLEDLFPDMDAFSHLSRFILLPNNMIWDRITRLHAMHFSHADKMVGVQVRTFRSDDQYAHKMVLDCLVNVSKALPRPIPFDRLGDLMDHRFWIEGVKEELKLLIRGSFKMQIAVLVSSLQDHHASFLKSTYIAGTSNDGTLVSVQSYTSAGEEIHNNIMDQLAFTEMWLLAMSDTLLTSYFSTFGYIAAGLSARKPYLMNIVSTMSTSEATGFEYNSRPVCELAVSSDPCYHSPPIGRQCAGMPEENSVPTYLSSCQDFDRGIRIKWQK